MEIEQDSEIDKLLIEKMKPPPTEEEIAAEEEKKKKEEKSKEDDFRKYLEEKGLMKLLTEYLVYFYEEVDKPEPVEYIRKRLSTMDGVDIEEVQKENEDLKKKIEEAKAKIEELSKQLE